jgi:hypothetical protein
MTARTERHPVIPANGAEGEGRRGVSEEGMR